MEISPDNLFEGNENFTLTINSSLLPNTVTVGDLNQATVTIVDDDGEFINKVIMILQLHFLSFGSVKLTVMPSSLS